MFDPIAAKLRWILAAFALAALAPASVGRADAQSTKIQVSAPFNASAWRGAGLRRLKWLFRVYLGRKPSVDEVDSLVRAAVTPAALEPTLLQMIDTQGPLAAGYHAAFERRVDGFVHGSGQAALAAGNQGRAGLADRPAMNADANLQQLLTPLLKAASDDPMRCSDASDTSGCFAAWLVDWIEPGRTSGGEVPHGTTYRQLLMAIASRH